MSTGVVVLAGILGVSTLVVIAISAYLLWDGYRPRNESPGEAYRRNVTGLHGSTKRRGGNGGWLGGAAGMAAGGLWMSGQGGDGSEHGGGDGGSSCGGSGCGGGGCGGGGG